MRIIFSIIIILCAHLATLSQAQILPDSGDQMSHIAFKLENQAVFTTGNLQSISCGDMAKRFSHCYVFVPLASKHEKICLRGNPLYKLPGIKDRDDKDEIVLFDRHKQFNNRNFTRAANLKNKEKGDWVSGLSAEEYPCHDFITKQTIEPKNLIPVPQSVTLRYTGQYLGAIYIDDCLLAERKLAFTGTSYAYKTMDFVCIVFPSSQAVSVSKIALDYVNELNAFSDWKSSPYALKKYNEGKHQKQMWLQRSDGENWKNIKCLENIRIGAVSEKDIQEFYRKNNTDTEIASGHEAIMFARNRFEDCPALE